MSTVLLVSPNELLRELRVALAVLLPRRERLVAIAGEDYKRDELDDLIDAAAALDLWLSKGGELPDAWLSHSPACLPDGPGCYDFRCNRCWQDVEPDPFPQMMGRTHRDSCKVRR